MERRRWRPPDHAAVRREARALLAQWAHRVGAGTDAHALVAAAGDDCAARVQSVLQRMHAAPVQVAEAPSRSPEPELAAPEPLPPPPPKPLLREANDQARDAAQPAQARVRKRAVAASEQRRRQQLELAEAARKVSSMPQYLPFLLHLSMQTLILYLRRKWRRSSSRPWSESDWPPSRPASESSAPWPSSRRALLPRLSSGTG